MKKKILFIIMLIMALAGSYISTTNAARSSVGTKPTFISEPPASLKVSKGEIVKIGAKATGTPAPEYRWYKDGYTIIPGDKYSITEDNGYTELTIKNIEDDDEGRYQVVAENSVGKEDRKCDLSVRYTP